MNIVPFLQQALFTLAMVAAWTTSKIDDQLVRILQIILNDQELTDAVADLLAQLKPTTPALNAATEMGDLKSIALGSFSEQHSEAVALVNGRFEGNAAAGQDKIRAAVEAAGIDWQKWISYLPMILQILSMFIKK